MLAWMPDIPCVFGVTDVKRKYDDEVDTITDTFKFMVQI